MNQEILINEKRISAKAHIALVLFLLYYCALQFIIMPALVRAGFFALFSSEIGAIVFQIIMHIIPLVLYLLLTRQHPKTVLPAVPLGRKNVIYIAVITFAIILIVLFVNHGHFNTIFNGVEPEPLELPGLRAIWIPLITFGVTTAAMEEVWYRGPLYMEYQKRGVSIFKTALITGVLFGIVHAGVFQVSYTALWGILMAYMFYYTRSFLAPLLSHVIGNSFAILLDPMFLLNDYNVFWNIKQTYVLILGILALLMIPVAIVCMRKLIVNNPREKEAATKESMLFTLCFWALILVMIAGAVLFAI